MFLVLAPKEQNKQQQKTVIVCVDFYLLFVRIGNFITFNTEAGVITQTMASHCNPNCN